MSVISSSIKPEQVVAKPFCDAAHSFFGMMLESKCEIKDIVPIGQHSLEPITASVAINGSYNGMVCISVTEEGAKLVLTRLTGLEPDELDDFVLDAVGEMANMIGGQGKRELSNEELQLGLPKLHLEELENLFEPDWDSTQHILLETDIGRCTLSLLFDLPQ